MSKCLRLDQANVSVQAESVGWHLSALWLCFVGGHCALMWHGSDSGDSWEKWWSRRIQGQVKKVTDYMRPRYGRIMDCCQHSWNLKKQEGPLAISWLGEPGPAWHWDKAQPSNEKWKCLGSSRQYRVRTAFSSTYCKKTEGAEVAGVSGQDEEEIRF